MDIKNRLIPELQLSDPSWRKTVIAEHQREWRDDQYLPEKSIEYGTKVADTMLRIVYKAVQAHRESSDYS